VWWQNGKCPGPDGEVAGREWRGTAPWCFAVLLLLLLLLLLSTRCLRCGAVQCSEDRPVAGVAVVQRLQAVGRHL
jgi:hypothetical protein